MCPISNRSASCSDGYGGDESFDPARDFTGSERSSIIKRANKNARLINVITKIYKIPIERANNYSEWSILTYCPFPLHKGGTERTPSFGYNFVRDFFHCFGCSNSGGAVEFLSLMESVPRHLVAEQILKETAGYDSNNDKLEELDDPQIEALLFDFANYLYTICQSNKDKPAVLDQLDKITRWFDGYLYASVPRKKMTVAGLEARILKAKSKLEKFE